MMMMRMMQLKLLPVSSTDLPLCEYHLQRQYLGWWLKLGVTPSEIHWHQIPILVELIFLDCGNSEKKKKEKQSDFRISTFFHGIFFYHY